MLRAMDMLSYFAVFLVSSSFISSHALVKAQEDYHRVVVRTLYVPLYRGSSNTSPITRKAVKSSTAFTESPQDYDLSKTSSAQYNGRQQVYHSVHFNPGNSINEQNYQKTQLPYDKREYYIGTLPSQQSYSQQLSNENYGQQHANLPPEQGNAVLSNKLVFPSASTSVKHGQQQESHSTDVSLQYSSGRIVSNSGKNEYEPGTAKSPIPTHGTFSYSQTPQSQITSPAQNSYPPTGDAQRVTDSSQAIYQIQQKPQSYQPPTVPNQFYTPQTSHQIYQQSAIISQSGVPSYQSDVSQQQNIDAFHSKRVVQHPASVQLPTGEQYRQQYQQSSLPPEQDYIQTTIPDSPQQNVAVVTQSQNSGSQQQRNTYSSPHSQTSQIQTYQPLSITPSQNALVGQPPAPSYEILTSQEQQNQQQDMFPTSPQMAYSNTYSAHTASRAMESQQIHHSNEVHTIPSLKQSSFRNTAAQYGTQTAPSPHVIENMYSDQPSLPESQQSYHYENTPYTQQLPVTNQQSSYNNLPPQTAQVMVVSKPNVLNQQLSDHSSQQILAQYTTNVPASHQETGTLEQQKSHASHNSPLQNSHAYSNYPEYGINTRKEIPQHTHTSYNSNPSQRVVFQDNSYETFNTNPRQVYIPPPDNYQIPVQLHQQQLQPGVHLIRPQDRDIVSMQHLKKIHSIPDGVLVHRLLASNSNQVQQPIRVRQGFQGFSANRNPSPHLEISLHHPQSNGYSAYKIMY